MILGLDTTFLVEAEVSGHPHHDWARRTLTEHLDRGGGIALAPQVLAEFAHVVTDPRRFSKPLSMDQALARADLWWWGRETTRVYPNDESGRLFLQWMRDHRLGRKRLLDTLLASTFFANGVRSILSSNARDFSVFGCFDVVRP